jgi:hypothetical protein
VTIPALLILKNVDDGDDKGICQTFFPPMFEDSATEDTALSREEKVQARKKYQDLKTDYCSLRKKATNAFDFYNLVEKSVLEMEDSCLLNNSDTQKDKERKETEDKLLQAQGMVRDDLQRIVQQIRILSMQLQRHKPAEWNEFLDVAL